MSQHRFVFCLFVILIAAHCALAQPFPPIDTTISNNPEQGIIYLSDFSFISHSYGLFLLKIDNAGRIISSRSSPKPLGALDFRPWPNGLFTFFDTKAQKYYGVDKTLQTLKDSFEVVSIGGDKVVADEHELQLFPNGNFMLLGTDTVTMDLSGSGGHKHAAVAFSVIEMFDKNKNLIFSWNAKDHFSVTEAVHQFLSDSIIDAVHANSLDTDADGNILLSCRSLDAVVKIDKGTGNILWQIGGVHNGFQWTNDTVKFSGQHHVRRLANGNITLFDNGFGRFPAFSRAVEYQIDENAKTIKKVWEYRHQPDFYASAMGSVQRLDNGNTLIGWGLASDTMLTEIDKDGKTVLEMTLPPNYFNYRVYKFPASFGMSVAQSESQAGSHNMKNFPNPFSQATTISFFTNQYEHITLGVYDQLGREVKTLYDGEIEAGEYSANFDASNLTAGVYWCKLVTPKEVITKKILLRK